MPTSPMKKITLAVLSVLTLATVGAQTKTPDSTLPITEVEKDTISQAAEKIVDKTIVQENIEPTITTITEKAQTVVTQTLATEASPIEIVPAPIHEATVSPWDYYFNRVSSYLVCSADANCSLDNETSAEILYATKDGKTLVYTDSPAKKLGIVDISDATHPINKQTIDLPGEPTSVTIKDHYALVVVNKAANYVDVAGELQVYDLNTASLVTTLDLGGQPDSIAISPNGQYAAVAIENERDEDLNDGAIPQLPAGYVMIIHTADTDAKNWTTQRVELTGLAEIAGNDPEPEYIDINYHNIAVVTLQENNHIVLIDLANAKVIHHFSAGSVDLENIDLTEGKPKHISMTESQKKIKREPDGVSWIDHQYFATANEGDYQGGSRGFSIFDIDGNVVWDSGNHVDHLAALMGHYPDKRSGNKGSEPENIEVGLFNGERLLFVNAERANLVLVYNVDDPVKPIFKQALPAGVGPEGGYAITSRNLLAVASEVDARKDKIRSSVSLYKYGDKVANYPSLIADMDDNELPIAWSALSGLAADPNDANRLYAIEDSFFGSNRIFSINITEQPALIEHAMPIIDNNGYLASMQSFDLAKQVNDDKTVNLDPEGIAVAADGGFWIVSEGSGTVGDTKKPFNYPNLLLKTDSHGEIQQVITLPQSMNDVQLRFGFEGVAEYNGLVYVALQRAWNKEANPRIGIYNPADTTWQFVYYPLEEKASPAGGWVGLSDMTAIGNGQFWVLERDNQGGPDAAIKSIYQIDLSDVKPGQTIEKTLVRDLLPDLKQANGLVAEKVEGLALTTDGKVYIVNDNDGVDDNSGETQLIHVMNQ